MNINNLKEINKNIDLDEYIKCREEVKANMKNPDWLGDFTKEDLVKLLNNNSKIWMYYNNEEFICSMMMIPSTKENMQKFNLNKNYKEVVDYGPMFVNYKYIGNNLQYQMLQKLDEYVKSLGYKTAVGTIHPDNIYSINNLIKDNFKLHSTKVFKRGIRNIYIKNME